MTSAPIVSIFDSYIQIPELMNGILQWAPDRLLECRLVSKLWRNHCCVYLDTTWKLLSDGNALLTLQGKVDIPLTIQALNWKIPLQIQAKGNTLSATVKTEEGICVVDPFVILFKKFQGLANSFREFRVEIPNRSLPTTMSNLQALQDEIGNKVLELVWDKKLCKLIKQAWKEVRIPGETDKARAERKAKLVPGIGAKAIREILDNPVNTPLLDKISLFSLSDENLKVLPHELHRLRKLQAIIYSNNKLHELPAFTKTDWPCLSELVLSNNLLSEIPNLAIMQEDGGLLLNDNPITFIAKETLEKFSGKVIKSFASQLNYSCASSLATLFQGVMKGNPAEQQKEILEKVGITDQNLIFEMVWTIAGEPAPKGREWGKLHVFDDMRRFGIAVRAVIIKKFDDMRDEQKNQVYRVILRFAERDAAANNTDLEEATAFLRWYLFSDLTNAKKAIACAKQNLLRLADALVAALSI